MPFRLSVSRWLPAVAVASALAVGLSQGSPVEAATRYDYAFPVVGRAGYAHKHSRYPGTDIIAKCGLTVVSPVDGVVLEVSRTDKWVKGSGGATRGGKFISIRGVDGVRYYASHLSRVKPGIVAGVRVRAGRVIGQVGRTGRAGSCHVHFGISPVCKGKGDWWIRRGTVWPWPYLDSWRKADKSKHRSPRSEVRNWQERNGCPQSP